jgi:hypothetical protein
MEARHLIGDLLDFLLLYGDRFAAACFAVALILALPLAVRLVRAAFRPLAALRPRAPRVAAAPIEDRRITG